MLSRSVLIAAFAVSSALSVPIVAQTSSNVQLLGSLGGYSRYNDVWGYVAPDGREYALVGTTTGTSIVNTTNPGSPFEVGFFPGPNSTWRDIRTLGQYAYVVTEGGGGMQIIDMSSPDTPVLVTTFGTNLWGNAHNICIDTSTSRIYAVGTNNGVVILDASTNPTNPTHLGNIPSPYLHDFAVENGIGHASALRDGEYEIWDMATIPPVVRSQTPTPGTFTHNVWPNAAQTVAVTTDEITGGVVGIYDISNPLSPQLRSTYTANSAAIPHNAFIVGDICHISFYTEGYRALDISDPSNPVEVGYYDTWPGSSGGFNGAWGCYPFQPSGNIYISDISTGLYILRLNELGVAHTPLGNSVDEIGPYEVVATINSGTPLSSVQLGWSVDGGAVTNVAMTPTGNPDEYAASIPGQSAPSEVAYTITATNAAGSLTVPSNGEYGFTVGSFTQVFFDDFENGTNGWTHAQVATQDDWQLGQPAGRSGTSGGVSWADPASAWSGSNVWGNDLGPSGFNGAYQPNVSNWLQSPPIPTNGVQGLKLRLRRWLTIQGSGSDQAQILVNGQLVWQNPASNLIDTAWEPMEVDISAVSDLASSIDVRFVLLTNGSTNLGGWNIDDFEIFNVTDCLPAQIYGVASAGSGGIAPQIAITGDAAVGATFDVQCAGLLGGAPSFLTVGFGSTNISALGVTLLVNPVEVTIPVTASGAAGVPAVGAANVLLTVPPDPTLDDLDVFFQWFAADAGAASGFLSASQGARIRICGG